jgi:hypothetical protein
MKRDGMRIRFVGPLAMAFLLSWGKPSMASVVGPPTCFMDILIETQSQESGTIIGLLSPPLCNPQLPRASCWASSCDRYEDKRIRLKGMHNRDSMRMIGRLQSIILGAQEGSIMGPGGVARFEHWEAVQVKEGEKPVPPEHLPHIKVEMLDTDALK